jgi:hypothetical protein
MLRSLGHKVTLENVGECSLTHYTGYSELLVIAKDKTHRAAFWCYGAAEPLNALSKLGAELRVVGKSLQKIGSGHKYRVIDLDPLDILVV